MGSVRCPKCGGEMECVGHKHVAVPGLLGVRSILVGLPLYRCTKCGFKEAIAPWCKKRYLQENRG